MTIRLTDRCCAGRDNNFNLIRMVAALCVIVSHAFTITGGLQAAEPLQALTGRSLGWYSVALFFFASGFLVARSFARQPCPWRWMCARAMRLFPGLLVMLVLTVLVLGPIVTSLPLAEYLRAPGTWSYGPRNLPLTFGQDELPGVFEANIVGPITNGSLWTLVYEVTCYAGVLAAGMAGLLHRPRAFAIALALFLLGYCACRLFLVEAEAGFGSSGARLMRLALPFALGMAAWVCREHLTLNRRQLAGFWLLAWLSSGTPLLAELILVAICYTVLYLAYVPRGIARHYNRLGDFSYGTYIYAFPMQQLAVAMVPGHDWQTNLLLNVPPTLLLAALSWKFVEQPCLVRTRSTPGTRSALYSARLVETG